MRSGEWERGKLYFDHHFAFFDRFPEEIELFAWWHLIRLVERIILKKKNLSKTDLPFRFVKLGSEILYLFIFKFINLSKTDLPFRFVKLGSEILYLFIFIKKWSFVVVVVVVVVVCLLQLCPILVYFF